MTASYDTRPLEIDDTSLEADRALLAVTSAPLELDYLRWLYRDNPRGAAVGFNAHADGKLVAHYATIPVAGTLDGAPAKGLLSLNTATHPEHQGKGLFTRLAEATYALARDRGYDFVVGVANANSTPGFTRKLGFQLVTPLDVLLGVGRLEASRAEVGFSLAWPDAALRWRLERPRAGYVAAPDGDGAIVHAPAHKLGVMAYLTRAPRSLVAELPRPRRTQPVRMWIGIDPQLSRRGLFAPLPDRFKPSPLNLIFRDLAGQRRLDRDTTRFTLLDFDAY